MMPQLATGGGGAAFAGGGGVTAQGGATGGAGGQKLQAGGLTGADQVEPLALGAPQLPWKLSMSLQPQKVFPPIAWCVQVRC